MQDLLTVILSITIIPLVIGLWQGADRKLTAACQGRKGPPLLQPFYDLFKLFTKERAISNPWQSFFAFLYLFATSLSLVMFYLGWDLLMIFFVQAAGAVFFVMGAICVQSPYSQVGAQRELLQVLAYEPLLFLIIVGFFLVTKSFMVETIVEYPEMLIQKLPLMLIVLSYVLTIKLRKSPFDIAACHHGHQEIVRGVQTEFAGRNFAITELAHWYEIGLILSMAALLCAPSILGIVLLLIGLFILEIIIDNICARLTWSFMLINTWIVGLSFAIINLIWIKVF